MRAFHNYKFFTGPVRLRQMLSRILFFLREYFFPCGCTLCDAVLFDMKETWYGLCQKCRKDLLNDISWMDGTSTNCAGPDKQENRCGLCGKPMVSGQGRCLSCRNGPERPYERLITIFSYSGIYRQLFSAYKFGKNLAVGNFFAELIVKALNVPHSEFPENFTIVPVPPRPGKIKKTGWDQVEYLTRLLEKNRRNSEMSRVYTVCRCLKRLPSKIQKNLDRSGRLQNLKGRIVMIKAPPPIAVIIDDVLTTGATMDVCASALKAGGCQKVYGICLVYD